MTSDQLPSKEQCKCTMSQSILGDGCEVCNPAQALEYAKERIAELERDLARTESAHAVVMAENKHYKQEAARWAFFRKHHMSDYQGKRLHAWLIDNLLRADGIDAAMDEVMSACSSQPPGAEQ